MITALNSALSGLHSASQKLDRVATDIVRGGTQSTADGQAGANDTDLVGGLADLSEAKTQFSANAKIIGAIARTEKHLLDILA